MSKIEQEIKVLYINVEDVKKKLLKLGAVFKGEKIKEFMYMIFLHYIIAF